MIENIKNKRPMISFGLGKTEATITLGESVTIWQNEIFNDDVYSLYFNDNKKESVYSFEYEPEEAGSFELSVVIRGKENLVERVSNTIKLIVEE